MSKRLSGAWFKLVTQRGDDLGVLMVPEEIGRHLERETLAWAHYPRPNMPISCFDPVSMGNAINLTVRQFHIVRAHYPHEDAIFLVGMSPEQVAEERGFAFLPSAHYMRCTHTDIRTGDPVPAPKVEEPKPEPPGPYLAAAREFSA